MTRFLAADLDAVDLLPALVQEGRRELLEEPGADGDGEPKRHHRRADPVEADARRLEGRQFVVAIEGQE